MTISYLKMREGELEVWPQILIDVDEGSRCHSHCRRAGFRVVHVEGADSSGHVEKGGLKGKVCAFVDFELHVKLSTAQVSYEKLVVTILIQVF